MTGFVYAISNGRDAVKIGFTNNPLKRLSQLQTGSADRLRLLGTQAGTEDDESERHAEFASDRIIGDWFRASKRVMAFASALTPWVHPKAAGTSHPLRAYRVKHSLTMSALAEAVGSSRQTIHRIENGQQEPSVALMRRLAEATKGEVPAAAILAACLASSGAPA